MRSIDFDFEVEYLKDLPAEFHLDIELWFLLSGEAEVTVGDESFLMTRNSVVVINSEKRHSIRKISDGIICRISLDYRAISEYLGSSLFLFFCNSVTDRNGEYDKLISLLQTLIATKLTRGGREDFGTYGLYYEILDLICKKFLIDHTDIRYRAFEDESSERMHDINRYIQANYNQDISLNELAEKLYLSNAYLSRFFKKNFGKNFKDYLNEVRLLHSIDDLLGTDKNMTKIAMDNGFPSVSRFNQVFKEVYHVSPLNYRAEHLQEMKQQEEDREIEKESLAHDIKEYVRAEHITTLDTEKTQTISIDVTKHKTAHKNWNRAINVGPLSDLMQGQVQTDILRIHKELDVTYVRFWNLFDSYICEENALYNFNRLDRTLDFLLENRMKPFIVLGGKDRDIMVSFGRPIYHQGTTENNFLKNPKAWEHLMKEFCRHLVKAFGVEEVSTWAFELRMPRPWDNFYTDDTDQHFRVWFDIAQKQLRSYFPYVMIGGCECPLGWQEKEEEKLAELFDFWKSIDFKPDFFSASIYPYEKDIPTMNSEYLRDAILIARRALDKNELSHLSIMVSEWSNTLSTRDVYNETVYKGSYIIQNLTMNMDIADKIMYWNASDVIAEYADSSGILYGGVGLLNKNGIPKPAFWAFVLLNRLYKYQVSCTRNYIVTTDGNGNYRVLCNNLKKLGYEYCMNYNRLNVKPAVYESYFEELNVLNLKIRLTGVPMGNYQVRRRMVSKENGSLYDELLRWEAPTELKHADIEYLKKICQPKLTLGNMDSREDALYLDVELPANAFELIELTYNVTNN